MRQYGQGVMDESEIYFSLPSAKAKKLFYYPLCTGHFFCDEAYRVQRDFYDSFLILHVIKGSCSFINKDGLEATARENETVIIDCYKPHTYCTHDNLESIWVHVAGCNSRDLCESIINDNGNIIKYKDYSKVKSSLLTIFYRVKDGGGVSEAETSAELYSLLLCLAEKSEDEGLVRNVREYIESHLSEDITVKMLSDTAHMSVTHFSRVFKERSGFSPYEYVLNVRLNRAKELLLKTNKTVTDIAYETGFNSEANFVYCFTKNEGISPGKFRRMAF